MNPCLALSMIVCLHAGVRDRVAIPPRVGAPQDAIAARSVEPASHPSFLGIQLSVANLDRSRQFYTRALGFHSVPEGDPERVAVLRNGKLDLVLMVSAPGELPAETEPTEIHEARTRGPYLNMRVGSLARMQAKLKSQDAVWVAEKAQPNAIGRFLRVRDPDGFPLNLIELDPAYGDYEGEPTVFNVGLRCSDLEAAARFYARLGFAVTTRDYLPRTLPLQQPNRTALALHAKPTNTERKNESRILFASDDFERDGNVLKADSAIEGPLGPVRSFASFGGVSGLLLRPRPEVAASRVTLNELFPPESSYRFGSSDAFTAAVTIADFDRDGDLDLLAANGRHWARQDLVHWNTGRGRFPTATRIGSELATSYEPAVADLDRDGLLDIVAARDRSHCLWMRGLGEGAFAPGIPIGMAGPTRSVAAADLNADSAPDLVFSVRGQANYVAYGPDFDQLQAFGKPEQTVRVALDDLDGDGDVDAVFANLGPEGAIVYFNDGQGRFEHSLRLGQASKSSVDVAVGDWNRDGRMDLAFASLAANALFLNHAEHPFEEVLLFGEKQERSYGCTFADLDRDGSLEIVVANDGSPNAVYFRTETGFERQLLPQDPKARSYGVAAGDLDGDGFPDLVFANSESMSRIHLSARPKVVRESPDR